MRFPLGFRDTGSRLDISRRAVVKVIPGGVEQSRSITPRQLRGIWFAHFPFAQPTALPSMSRLSQPLHSRLRSRWQTA